MSFLDRIRECNEHDLSRFRPLLVGRARIGWVRDGMARRLADFPDVFSVAADCVAEAIVRAIRAATALGGLPGWRDLFLGPAADP